MPLALLYSEYYQPIRMAYAMAVPETMRPHPVIMAFRASRVSESARLSWGVPADAVAGSPLTDRERDVMRWLSSGKTDKDIAGILGISHRTVHKHLQRVYEKLGVETRTAAVARWKGLKIV